MLGEGALTALRMRHAPQAVLQLRLFGVQEHLNRALIARTVGITVGIVAVLPMTLEVSVPELGYYATSVLSAGLAWCAILQMGPMFRVAGASARTQAERTSE